MINVHAVNKKKKKKTKIQSTNHLNFSSDSYSLLRSIKDKRYNIQYCIKIESKYYTCNHIGHCHLNLLDLLELGSDMKDAPTPIIVI